MVTMLAACGGGRKKKMQKKRICREEREDLAVAAIIAGEDLDSWGGWDAVCWWRRNFYVGSSRAKEAAGRDREERTLAGRKTGEKLIFWLILDLIFSSLRPWNPLLFIDDGRGQSCLHREKNFSPWFGWEGSRPLAQSRHGALSNLQKKLPELACLGRRRRRWVVI